MDTGILPTSKPNRSGWPKSSGLFPILWRNRAESSILSDCRTSTHISTICTLTIWKTGNGCWIPCMNASQRSWEYGVNYIDMRSVYDELGRPMEFYSLTDHHYSFYGALTAYRVLLGRINEDTGMGPENPYIRRHADKGTAQPVPGFPQPKAPWPALCRSMPHITSSMIRSLLALGQWPVDRCPDI